MLTTVRAKHRVSFVGSHSDLYHASGTAAMYVISCYIGSRYNGSRLYSQSGQNPIECICEQNRWLDEPLIGNIQYVPLGMHTISFALFCCGSTLSSGWIPANYLPKFTGGELRNGVNGFLTSYATDSARFRSRFLTSSPRNSILACLDTRRSLHM